MNIDPEIILGDVLTEYKRLQMLNHGVVIQKKLPEETQAVVNVFCKLLEKALNNNESYKVDNLNIY